MKNINDINEDNGNCNGANGDRSENDINGQEQLSSFKPANTISSSSAATTIGNTSRSSSAASLRPTSPLEQKYPNEEEEKQQQQQNEEDDDIHSDVHEEDDQVAELTAHTANLSPFDVNLEVKFTTDQIFDNNFKRGDKLGEASFSTIFLGTHKASNKQYAIKQMNRNSMNFSMSSSAATFKDRNFLQDEIDNLIAARDGTHIVDLYEIYKEGPDFYLVMEYVRGGELFDLILERDGEFSESEAIEYTRNILHALEYVHSKRIAHRDVKPENILLTQPVEQQQQSFSSSISPSTPICKLCDFGFSKKVLMYNGCRTLCGTPGYMAPEILERWPAYDVQCDMWSVGVILFLFLGSYLPFEDEDDQPEDVLFERTRNGQYYFYPEYWGDVSKSAKDFVTMMLTINPNKRISASDALQNEWLNSHKNKQDQHDPANKSPSSKHTSRRISRDTSRNISKNLSRNMSRQVSSNASNNRLVQLTESFAGYLERKGIQKQVTRTNSKIDSLFGMNSSMKGSVRERTLSNDDIDDLHSPMTLDEIFKSRSEGSGLTKSIVPDSQAGKPFHHFYNVGELIGEGGYASVYHAEHKERPEIAYAVKDVDLSELSQNPGDSSSLREEIWALLLLRGGPHIIQLYDVFEEPEHVYLVMEEMKGGDLLNRIGEKEIYTEREARKTCKIIFEAMDYIHKKKVAHRDIKPENILLVKEADDTTIKIADFGFAKKVPRLNSLRTLCGTAQYVAPEVLELKGKGYDQRADMWSVGVVAYILLGGYAPFEGPVEELAESILTGTYYFHKQYWSEISTSAKEMISNLLEVDVDKRLSAEEALQCTWMTLEEETLNVTDLSGAKEAIKKSKALEAQSSIAGQVRAIGSKHDSLGKDFTEGMNNFMDLTARKKCHSNMNLGLDLGVVQEDEICVLLDDSSSGKPFDSLYKWGKALGEGGFSVTHIATHRKSNVEFAVKRVTRKDLEPSDAVALQDEVSALHAVAECDQIVHLHDVFDEPDYTYLILEHTEGGPLIDRITQIETYTEADARAVIKQLLRGVQFCHEKRIAHRRLNPENILLVNKESDVDIKISDFSFAKKVPYPNSLRTQCGTEGFVAPEILEHRPAYDVQCDMWTVGVVLYLLLGGYRPFRGESHEVMRQIRYGEYKFHQRYWQHVSDEAKRLINRMLTVSPTLRITASLALESDWLTMSQEDLGHNHLKDNFALLQEFRERAKAKFRAAVHVITATKKLESLGANFHAFENF